MKTKSFFVTESGVCDDGYVVYFNNEHNLYPNRRIALAMPRKLMFYPEPGFWFQLTTEELQELVNITDSLVVDSTNAGTAIVPSMLL